MNVSIGNLVKGNWKSVILIKIWRFRRVISWIWRRKHESVKLTLLIESLNLKQVLIEGWWLSWLIIERITHLRRWKYRWKEQENKWAYEWFNKYEKKIKKGRRK